MKIQTNNNFTFQAGLTKSIKSEISSCSPKQIESYMIQNGINAYFKNNKLIAWCSLKSFEFVKCLNKKYYLNLGYPNGIIAEDYEKLNGTGPYSLGATNLSPSYLYKNSKVIIPEKTIFFNYTKINTENIDDIADRCFERGISTTDFFLECFLHEFMHVVHENNLLLKLGGTKLLNNLNLIKNPFFLVEFSKKYGKLFSKICHYAGSNPLETVACDLSKRSIQNIDKETMLPKKNLFVLTPYTKKTFLTRKRETKNDMLLRNFWNGNFEK